MSGPDDVARYNRDAIYLAKREGAPKQMFVDVADVLAAHFGSAGPPTLLDVGCASGAFLDYAKQRFPELTATGLDISPALVEAARRDVREVSFDVGDANTLQGVADASFDAVTMTGTHSIFDDFRDSFAACIRVAKSGGLVAITGLFNDHPLDARIHWREPAGFGSPWRPGYNLVSKVSVAAFLAAEPRTGSHTYVRFAPRFDLAPQDDPVRSWTRTAADGSRELVNGIMPLSLETLLIRLL